MVRRIQLLILVVASLWAGGICPGYAGSSEGPTYLPHRFSFSDPFRGRFDKLQLQRGLQVYTEICAACHGLKYVRFRNLADIGLSEMKIKALAAEYEFLDGPNDEGEMYLRPGLPTDPMKSPYANDQEARVANNGALPPDLSLMAKARKGGPSYIFAFLMGYRDDVPKDFAIWYKEKSRQQKIERFRSSPESAPPGIQEDDIVGDEFTLGEGMHFNLAYPGYQVAMAQPIYNRIINYDWQTPLLGEEASVTQWDISEDISAFLTWAAMPELEERRLLGRKVMAYLMLLTLLLYILYKITWLRVK